MRDTIIQGDTLTVLKTLPDQLVDMIVTSPAYWGLRDYGVAGQLGLEPTIGEYISNIVAVFEEVRQVLKDTGTLWLNMGDAYAQQGGKRFDDKEADAAIKRGIEKGYESQPAGWTGRGDRAANTAGNGLKPKDLIGQPWRLAFALQAAGWYLRSDIIWHKPNPMPESVTDRPTKSHEYIFLLSKKAKYFYDAEAIKESLCGPVHKPGNKNICSYKTDTGHLENREWGSEAGRNKRTVWTIATQPYPEAHFATFPEKLVEPCIRAGTSERGNCAECGKPWVRVVEKEIPPEETRTNTIQSTDINVNRGFSIDGRKMGSGQKLQKWLDNHPPQTVGWKPSCSCDSEETVSPIVLDPFMGSGTVGLVAKKLNRDYLGIELNPEYIEMAEKRIRGSMGLFVKGN